jgi:perosamine synthetase
MGERLALHGGTPAVPQGIQRAWPRILEEDKAAVMAVLDRGIIGGAEAPEAMALQHEFADYIGARYCLATNSGTAALHLALLSLDLAPGDEVITAAFTFSASALAILHALAIPIFVDVDPRTFTLDVNQLEAAITPRTRAIIPVHLHGMPADLDPILAIAARHGITVIEDACQAHGAAYKGRRVGAIASMGAFSLNYTKSLPGGEGGFFVTNDEQLLKRANMFRIFGERSERLDDELFRPYFSYVIGWNHRSQEMPAAFTRSQLRRLDESNGRAIANAAALTEALSRYPGVRPPHVPDGYVHTFQKYRVRLDPTAMGLDIPPVRLRNLLLHALRAEGVEAVLWHTTPLPAYPLFQERTGYGGHFPWTMSPASREITYDATAFPVATALLNDSLLIGSERYPLCGQEPEVMPYVVAGIHKVFGALEELVAAELAGAAAS